MLTFSLTLTVTELAPVVSFQETFARRVKETKTASLPFFLNIYKTSFDERIVF